MTVLQGAQDWGPKGSKNLELGAFSAGEVTFCSAAQGPFWA